MNIEIIAGSPREGSVTHGVALYLQKYFEQKHYDCKIGLIDAREWNLPPQQTVFNSIDNTPPEFKALSQRMFAADAFILVSPEYNGSYTPLLKTVLDYYPKQSRKSFGIVSTSRGAFGGIRAAIQMQTLALAIFGIVSPQMLVVPHLHQKFDNSGNLIDGAYEKNVHDFATEFIWLAERLAKH